MDYRASTRPRTVHTENGQPQPPAHETGPQVRTLDAWQRIVAPNRTVDMNGRSYMSGEVVTVTAAMGDTLQQAGDVLPIGQHVRQAAPAVVVGRIEEGDVMTQVNRGVRIEGH